jgi:hypothetical protein
MASVSRSVSRRSRSTVSSVLRDSIQPQRCCSRSSSRRVWSRSRRSCLMVALAVVSCSPRSRTVAPDQNPHPTATHSSNGCTADTPPRDCPNHSHEPSGSPRHQPNHPCSSPPSTTSHDRPESTATYRSTNTSDSPPTPPHDSQATPSRTANGRTPEHQRLCDELTDRGLVTRPGRYPAGPISDTQLSNVPADRFYLGYVSWKNPETGLAEAVQGRHLALVDAETFERVQKILQSRTKSGERQRKHQHYLN